MPGTKVNMEKVSDREIELKRTFNAPQDLVWRAWTEPELIAKWWGPQGFSTEVKQMDVRPGGVWHYCMRSEEWGDAWGRADYQEVEPQTRIVYVDAFSNEEGDAIPPQATVTLTYEPDGDRTLVTSRTRYEQAEDLQQVLEMGMEQGFAETLDNLDALLAEMTAGGAR